MREKFSLARFLAEVMVLSQHPEEFKMEEIQERMYRNMATMSRILGEHEKERFYLEVAGRKRAIRLSAMQSTKTKLS